MLIGKSLCVEFCDGSYRPPATVLAKPNPVRNRRESSDAEPTPPSSPVDMIPEDTVSNITVSLAYQR